MRTPRPWPGPCPPDAALACLTSRPLPGPVLLLLEVSGAAMGSARREAASDGLRAAAERKARVSSTPWLPLLSLLFSVCSPVPTRKQVRSSYSPVLCWKDPWGNLGEREELESRLSQPSHLRTLSAGPVRIKTRQHWVYRIRLRLNIGFGVSLSPQSWAWEDIWD